MASKKKPQQPESGSLIMQAEPDDLKEYAVLSYSPYNISQALLKLDMELLNVRSRDSERVFAYLDYDDMEASIPEVKVALDIYADVACMGDEGDDESFEIITKDKEVKKILEDMVERLDLYETVWSVARDVRKYGDAFEQITVDKSGKFIQSIDNLSVYTMSRIEDKYGQLLRFEQSPLEGKAEKPIFIDKESVIHLRSDRMRNAYPLDPERHKYGVSCLFPLRRLFPLLVRMEEGMVVGRLYRSHMRYKVVVDVTGKTDEQVKETLSYYKKQFKKRKIYNPLTGKIDMSRLSGILDATDDFFIGVKKDGATPDVATVGEQGTLGNINDVLYFQNKLFAVLKLPKAFMGYEKDVNSRATVAAQDVEFGRTVRRLQTLLSNFVTQVCQRELELQGRRKADFTIKFADVNIADEQGKATVLSTKATAVASLIKDGIMDADYAADELFHIEPDDYDEIKKRVDKKRKEEEEKAAKKTKDEFPFSMSADPDMRDVMREEIAFARKHSNGD